MKKYFILTAAAILALGACTKIENGENVPEIDVPVSMGAYTGKTVTKAGAAGELTNDQLKANGFGVFAYQTTGTAALDTPNFMYNTKVSGDSWTYSPVKYWPNQIQAGNTDSQTPAAQAAQADKVSFFAYAPYVNHKAAMGTTGITALTANNASGDPKVTYAASTTLDEQVDLCWGVVNPTTDQTWATVAGTNISLAKGMPFLGLQKPALNTTIHFYFRHALAQLNLKAVAAYNQVPAGGTAQNGVKITIEKVELTVPGMNTSAKLNLNNTTANTPKWEDATGSSDLVLTVDGANINAALKDAGNDKKASEQPTGVTATPTDVIVANKYFTVIPADAAKKINVKVTYYVTTDDADLATGYSRVKNVISKDVDFAALAAGTKNTIKMILGISEVKFEAEVTEWETGTATEVNLPVNS